MSDLEKWRALANFRPSIERSPWEGNMCAYLADAANQVEALERENAAMAKVVEAARAIIDRNEAVTFDCSCLGGEQCRMCGQLKGWKLALAALASPKAPATSKETP